MNDWGRILSIFDPTTIEMTPLFCPYPPSRPLAPGRLIILNWKRDADARSTASGNSLRGNPMTRQVLIAIGTALLTVGGTGLIVALVWLTANKLHGTLPNFYDARAETLLFLLPVLLLTIAIVGAAFVSSALALRPTGARTLRNLHPHTRFHV